MYIVDFCSNIGIITIIVIYSHYLFGVPSSFTAAYIRADIIYVKEVAAASKSCLIQAILK